MLQGINDRINITFETKVTKGTEDILTLIREEIRNYKWHSPLTGGYVNFSEFKINGDKIEILRMPGMLTAFKSHGRIILYLSKTEKQDLTKVKCEIRPGDNSFPYILAFLLLIFFLWIMLLVSVGFFMGMTGLTSKVIGSIVVFCIPVLFIYIKYRIARVALTDYSEAVIKLIRK